MWANGRWNNHIVEKGRIEKDGETRVAGDNFGAGWASDSDEGNEGGRVESTRAIGGRRDQNLRIKANGKSVCQYIKDRQ